MASSDVTSKKQSPPFKTERKLPVTATLNAATWDAINTDIAPALMDYTMTAEDLKGPFVPIPADMKGKSELPYLGYSSPLEEIGEKFHSSPEVLRSLNPGANFEKEGQPLTVPNVQVMPPPQAASIVVSKGESSVRVYDASGGAAGVLRRHHRQQRSRSSAGRRLDGQRHLQQSEIPLQRGLFWDAKDTTEKETLPPGPNSPVGLVWIDLSKEHYGIHGTPEPGKIGHTSSHGCIRLTNWDALELASIVQPDTPVTFKE